MQERVILSEPIEFDGFPNVKSESFVFEYRDYILSTTPETRIDIKRSMITQFAEYDFGKSTYHDVRLQWEHGILHLRFTEKKCELDTKKCFFHCAMLRPEILVSLIIQAEAMNSQNNGCLIRYCSDYYGSLPYKLSVGKVSPNWEFMLRKELERRRNIKREQIHILCDADSIPPQDLSNRPDFEIMVSKYEDVTLFYKQRDPSWDLKSKRMTNR